MTLEARIAHFEQQLAEAEADQARPLLLKFVEGLSPELRAALAGALAAVDGDAVGSAGEGRYSERGKHGKKSNRAAAPSAPPTTQTPA